MKKGLLMILAAAFVLNVSCLFAQEQQELKIKEPGRTEFVPHWYMQIQGGAAYTLGEAKFGDLISPAAALNFGYKFTPAFALRFGVNGWQAKGGWVVNPNADYKYNFAQANVDAVFDLSNLLGNFNPTRTFNFYGFVGAGLNYAFNNDEAVVLNQYPHADLELLWEDSKLFGVGRVGLGMDIRLSDYVALNVEGNANILSDKFNSKKAGNVDWQFNALIGLTIKFNKGYKTIPPVYYAPEPAPAPTA